MTIIGGADGSTSVFIASEPGWINLFGLILVTLMMLPNLLYAFRTRNSGAPGVPTPRALNLLEQIGRYGCMFLMIFNVGLFEFGFASVAAFLIYAIGSAVLLILYYIFWALYFKTPRRFFALMLAILPTLLFLLSGATLRHWLLVLFAILFGVSHIWISAIHASDAEKEGTA